MKKGVFLFWCTGWGVRVKGVGEYGNPKPNISTTLQ